MPKHTYNPRRNSVADIERVVLLRISTGRNRARNRIPHCEQLAKELGANKNTVSKAYHVLAEHGFLNPRAGRGTFVTKRPPSAFRSGALVNNRRQRNRTLAVSDVVLDTISAQLALAGPSLLDATGDGVDVTVSALGSG